MEQKDLTALEFDLLGALIDAGGRVLSLADCRSESARDSSSQALSKDSGRAYVLRSQPICAGSVQPVEIVPVAF